MFLSFIVPVFNTEKYLPECLDSLLEQDIPNEEYEIICVNDGSTDNSLNILHAYQEKFPNIVVIDKENGGVATARNVGMNAAGGDYIWFVDSDDFIHTNILKKLRDTVMATECDRLSVGSYSFTNFLSPEEQALLHNNCLQVNSHFFDSVVWGSLFRKAFLIENRCWFHYPDITHGEDMLFMYEYMSHFPKFVTYSELVYFYRIRPESAQTSTNIEVKNKQLKSYMHATELMQRHYINALSQNKQAAANLLMAFLWDTLLGAAKAPKEIRTSVLMYLRDLKLFPCKRPAECTLVKSYQTTRTDFLGQLFDYIYINMHRPWGFWAMFFLQRLINLKHRVVNAG